ncbi:hypothetical protein U6A24_16895 [Aquimarina gracilis]|uniref:Uncharacterized protein n=1 Tax=Aquimarina gracilis TaxID=874422 RepID=A0ABU5ZZ16_9FLAO|nr:hypothetical protein [Aquimarina gracilis]MEB3347154.1 hypothetical protein [Aquimarina gracilis]
MDTAHEDSQTQRKANIFTGLLLFLISIILFITTTPIGFIYGFFHRIFTGFLKGLGGYFLEIAVSIDQLGNVIMQHLLNLLWIKKDGYTFGNRDETISSVLGKNQVDGTLSGFGKLIVKILDAIDPNHVLDSIDYNIESKN